MNILSFVAIRRITAASFTVCAQLKILTTAACAVALLQRRLSWVKVFVMYIYIYIYIHRILYYTYPGIVYLYIVYKYIIYLYIIYLSPNSLY